LGANLGDRRTTLQAAVDALAAHPDVDVLQVSEVVETDPVGGPEGQPAYLNAVLLISTALSPEDLLALAHRIEAEHGRVRQERWGPRTLDIDILAFDDLVRTAPDPVLPHPRSWQRAFVLVPWAQADPAAVLPGVGPVAILAEACDASGVRPRPDLVLHA
jgi:2-amino-4-hydroxy-6-hydroxymethyldihydropteridine diphosphokinase